MRVALDDVAGLTAALATTADAAELAALHAAAAGWLTREHGRGAWSRAPTESAFLRAADSKHARVLTLRAGGRIVASLTLTRARPRAVDAGLFTPCDRPLYLTDMAVAPDAQGLGLGRRALAEAVAVARAWGADAIRLDAYDGSAGAGGFYACCGWREVGRVVYRNTPLVQFERLLG